MKKIPPFKLIPEPLTDEGRSLRKFQWAGDDIGTRHRLGGDPAFIQSEDYPNCESCCKKMTFYAQLDSINDDFCIADCGMIYVFICFECNEIYAFIQSY